MDENSKVASLLAAASTPASAALNMTQHGGPDSKRVQQRFEEVSFETSAKVNSKLVLLNTLVAAAPLAGLLGTVIGMLNTFGGLAAGGSESMSLVAVASLVLDP